MGSNLIFARSGVVASTVQSYSSACFCFHACIVVTASYILFEIKRDRSDHTRLKIVITRKKTFNSSARTAETEVTRFSIWFHFTERSGPHAHLITCSFLLDLLHEPIFVDYQRSAKSKGCHKTSCSCFYAICLLFLRKQVGEKCFVQASHLPVILWW